jgi:hypothetical protein
MGELLIYGVLGSQLVVIGVIAWNEASHAKTWRAQSKLNLEINNSLIEIEEQVERLTERINADLS